MNQYLFLFIFTISTIYVGFTIKKMRFINFLSNSKLITCINVLILLLQFFVDLNLWKTNEDTYKMSLYIREMSEISNKQLN